MKTTVELPTALFREVKRRALEEETTFRALIEEGLREVLRKRQQSRRFVLEDMSFGGDGLREGVRLDDWDAIRDLIYTGRGA